MLNADWFNSLQAIVKNVYNHLQDDLSKEIFKNRLMYSLTDDYEHIRKIVRKTDEVKEIRSILERFNGNKKLILDGAGSMGELVYNLFPGVKWLCFSDKKVSKKEFCGLPVIKREHAVKSYPDAVFVITSYTYEKEIYRELIALGVKAENILNIGRKRKEQETRQYFKEPFIEYSEDEVIVDGGCYNGQTISNFYDNNKGIAKRIYAFEPDLINYNNCKVYINEKGYDNVQLFNKGLWNESTRLKFNAEHGEGSSVTDSGAEIIYVTSIDEAIKEDVTFIKLDVEGSELNALIGAKNTIMKNKPKMAICIYHIKSDILEIARYILSLREDYKLYIRHYSFDSLETVLYSI